MRASDYPQRAYEYPHPPPPTSQKGTQLSTVEAFGRYTVFADWSLNRGMATVDSEGERKLYLEFQELLKAVPCGSAVVCESSTFGSFGMNRTELLALAAARDILLGSLSTRQNTKRRDRAGFVERDDKGVAKPKGQSVESDFQDATAMRLAVSDGTHVKLVTMPDDGWNARAEEAARYHMNIRRGRENRRLNRNGNPTSDAVKDRIGREVADRLPAFSTVPAEVQVAIGDSKGKDYNTALVATVASASKFVKNRAEFERLCGLHENGYPNIYRSEFYYWGYRPRRDRVTLSQYRKGLRYLYAVVKALEPY